MINDPMHEATDKMKTPANSGYRSLHGLFEARVQAAPETTAVIIDGRRMSYRELNAHANRLAHHLIDAFGVGCEDLVGLLVDRSERMLIGLLAAMKAGAGYVPIDPKYPTEAIRQMLDDCAAKAFVVDSDHVGKVGEFLARTFIVDMELDGLASPEEDPGARGCDANLAYAIYTSGSTGRRKGVLVEHRAIVRTILWRQRYYGLDESMISVQIPSYALDSSIVDIFATLSVGGALILLPEDSRTDVSYIRGLVDDHAATHLLATPTFYRVLLPLLEGAASLACVTVAGEATPQDLVDMHHRILPNTRLVNEYGPTENAVCSTAAELVRGAVYVTIGAPIDDTEVLLLDEHMRPVPEGAEGEIFLGGERLARAYLNRPELTAERFVPHQQPGSDGQRLYRTGDAARRHADGGLEFLGRLDHQVKIRGHRVELGEIEALLREHDDVHDAVVICADNDGEKSLVAYVVANGDPSESRLRRYLAGLVPDHMLPSTIVPIASVPMTANGKIDRAALPEPTADGGRVSDSMSPRNRTEEQLIGIWRQILNVGNVCVHDNFFEIGGNSLRAAQLQSEIYSHFGFELNLQRLFADSTIARLAETIASERGDDAAVSDGARESESAGPRFGGV